MEMVAHLPVLQPIQDSDSDFRDSSSDGSSDCEPERGSNVLRETRNHYMASEMSLRMDRLSMGDQQILQEDLSSDEGELVNSSCLIFEYFERDPPYSREPLADKVNMCYAFSLLFPFYSRINACLLNLICANRLQIWPSSSLN
uniref:Uncharacterized protein n=1 Tax=Gossypium raimondii TaxID=29730 RepID=A0A0D2Q5R2_GOSRA|nr:hypothetical protein B456_002G139400 [Gossypium raimondii]KJB12041.1 hypothetical protein B456_002G139400 [Gossypium raimondii]